jgi:hypothetical protein
VSCVGGNVDGSKVRIRIVELADEGAKDGEKRQDAQDGEPNHRALLPEEPASDEASVADALDLAGAGSVGLELELGVGELRVLVVLLFHCHPPSSS